MIIHLSLLAFFGLLIYGYIYPVKLIGKLNNGYCYLYDFYNMFVTNEFISKQTIETDDDNKTIIHTYSFRNNDYVIVAPKSKFNKEPYTIKHIYDLQKMDTIGLKTNTPEDIIYANIILKDKNEIDFSKTIRKLSGPLGNFYKGTSNELTKYSLKLYINHYYYDNFVNINILGSDGIEYNLLDSLPN